MFKAKADIMVEPKGSISIKVKTDMVSTLFNLRGRAINETANKAINIKVFDIYF